MLLIDGHGAPSPDIRQFCSWGSSGLVLGRLGLSWPWLDRLSFGLGLFGSAQLVQLGAARSSPARRGSAWCEAGPTQFLPAALLRKRVESETNGSIQQPRIRNLLETRVGNQLFSNWNVLETNRNQLHTRIGNQLFWNRKLLTASREPRISLESETVDPRNGNHGSTTMLSATPDSLQALSESLSS